MRTHRLLPAAALVALAAHAPALAAQEPVVDPGLYATMAWRLVGPFRGGRSVAVAGVRGQPRVYYFGGVGGGVWKTTDAGITWGNVTDGYVNTASVGAIAVAPSDPNVVYVGMGEDAPRGVTTSHGDGVYRSTDAGKTWTHLGLDATRSISRIVVHPTDPDRVWVAAQGSPYGPTQERGIYRSGDGGRTWEKVLFVNENAGASDLSMDPSNPRILYAAFWDYTRHPWKMRSGGAGSGIWKSTDAGSTWMRVGEGLPDLMGKVGVSVSGANPDRVYAIVEAEPDGGVFRSDDAGATWTRVNHTRGLRSRPWYYMEIYADPGDENTVYVMNAPLWRSVDGGKTFQSLRQEHGDNHDLWINPDDPDNFINGNDGGAAVTFNGGETWSTLRNQPTAQFYRVNTDNRFPYRLYGGQQDNSSVVIKSQDLNAGGIGWGDFHPSAGCESAYLAFDPDDPRYQYGGCYLGQISEYDELTGLSRNVQAEPGMPASIQPKDMTYRFNWNAPIVASPEDPSVIYHGGNVVLRTRDRGDSWEVISPDLTRNDTTKQGPGGGPITNEGAGGEVYGTVFSIAPSPLDAGIIWTGSDDGMVYVTRDGGGSWTDVTPPGLGEVQINAVEASPHEPGKAYIAVTRYKLGDFTPLAYRTDDFGESWTEIDDGIAANHWVRVVREDTEVPGLLYAGTELGAYASFDDGAHWQTLQLDLPV
ncbi:MAG: glycosyl hydrolase, partial [Gemmatimonadota bacterium]